MTAPPPARTVAPRPSTRTKELEHDPRTPADQLCHPRLASPPSRRSGNELTAGSREHALDRRCAHNAPATRARPSMNPLPGSAGCRPFAGGSACGRSGPLARLLCEQTGIVAVAMRLESERLTRRLSCCVRAEGCGLDRGVSRRRRTPAERRGSAMTFALIERRGEKAGRMRSLCTLCTTRAWVQRRSCGRWARTWKTEVKPRSKPRQAARTYGRQIRVRSAPMSASARSQCSSRLRAHSRRVRA